MTSEVGTRRQKEGSPHRSLEHAQGDLREMDLANLQRCGTSLAPKARISHRTRCEFKEGCAMPQDPSSTLDGVQPGDVSKDSPRGRVGKVAGCCFADDRRERGGALKDVDCQHPAPLATDPAEAVEPMLQLETAPISAPLPPEESASVTSLPLEPSAEDKETREAVLLELRGLDASLVKGKAVHQLFALIESTLVLLPSYDASRGKAVVEAWSPGSSGRLTFRLQSPALCFAAQRVLDGQQMFRFTVEALVLNFQKPSTGRSSH